VAPTNSLDNKVMCGSAASSDVWQLNLELLLPKPSQDERDTEESMALTNYIIEVGRSFVAQ